MSDIENEVAMEVQELPPVPPKRAKDMTAEEYNAFRREYMRNWRDANRQHFREKCRIHSKRYYQLNRDQVLAEKRRKREETRIEVGLPIRV
jgi:hypothetical protein